MKYLFLLVPVLLFSQNNYIIYNVYFSQSASSPVLEFDANDYIIAPSFNISSPPGEIDITFFFNAGGTSDAALLALQDGPGDIKTGGLEAFAIFWEKSTGKIVYHRYDSGFGGLSRGYLVISSGAWHKCRFHFTGSEVNLYVDDILLVNETFPGWPINQFVSNYFGYCVYNGTTYYAGDGTKITVLSGNYKFGTLYSDAGQTEALIGETIEQINNSGDIGGDFTQPTTDNMPTFSEYLKVGGR